ncbi:hypothetical protein ABH37_16950 [Mycobacterium haemophilum]|uniref:ATPase n=1 Tax=Mycobacterium haemophilum TaxID=29311 RepID=A0A0I9TDF8_9MYCO|nr:hypothetical protein ABH39_15850 [Mycobacterium haemophilum]KLO35187.1 hypothetical protein ABH38_16840 [Mycobacterium haemophilum]KLO40177.1 hypothetical protein ABH37_16950 [Mycobacterium haemophilum]KLO47458.1 hypothetical protein ABH36_16765 [Mycobacterium haemophilum]
MQSRCREWRQDVCGDLPPADGGGLCHPGHRGQAGGSTVSVANIIGLVLAVLIALLLFAALLFPERF